MTTRAVLPLLLTATVVALAGCAREATPASQPGPGGTTTGPATSTTAGPTPTGTPTAAPTTPAAGTRCHTGDLAIRLVAGSPGAGQRYASIVLTNTTARTCTIYGYGGLVLLDPARHELPTRVLRDPTAPPRTVVLRSGQQAASQLHWTVVPDAHEPTTGPCEPTPAYLRVIPPDERTSLTTPWPYGPVCQHGKITQGAYRPGSGE
ncbi:MAG TPA: DUF4232 domain-containing protein [Mycobacteriales bacterium]|nr:DUF4232 domain-containing protein [Mycobacteriales bacterium]